jgi:glycosyltransferase involved in cell wall biosynthesis
MPLRILHTIHSVNPAGGGPIEGLKQISAVNRNHGHVIEIASMDAPGAPWVRECPLPCHAMGPSLFGYGYNSRFVPWLREHRRDYDVVIVNGIWQYNAFGTWRALRGTPTPYFVFTHGMLDPWFKRTYPLKHLKKWLYWPWADYRVLRDATAVLFTCEEERRLARQSFWLYKCDESVVNYGTAGPAGDPAAQRRLFLERFPALAGKRLLLFLGRVHVKKGPDLLFKAFAAILRESPAEQTRDLHLVMAGPNDHPYAREMVALAKTLGLSDRVTWTGMITGDLKWGAFYAADAFVLPSHQENFGIAVAEALACGLPVLISNKVNIWREIQLHKAGLVEADDVEGTYILMERWLNMPAADRDLMRGRAKECFDERFHVNQTAQLLIRLLHTFGLHGLPTDQA